MTAFPNAPESVRGANLFPAKSDIWHVLLAGRGDDVKPRASLAWVLLLGAVMALEKNFSWGRRLSAPIGMLLFIAAVAVMLEGIRS